MSTAPKRLLTPQEYLARERAAETRSEYYRGEMFAMSGASWEHTLIKDNIAREAGNALRNGPCRVVTSDLRVKVDATGLYTYPDVVIVCGSPRFEDNQFDTLLNPQIIVEVLSDSTEKYDRGKKFNHYRQVNALQEFVLIAQNEPTIDRYVRQGDASWNLTSYAGVGTTFSFATIEVHITMSEIYRGVTFPETPSR
jgi:Uma2 family endonuclease